MSLLANFVAIPIFIVTVDAPNKELRLATVKWDSTPAQFAAPLAAAAAPATAAEAHSYANGYGGPQQKITLKVFGNVGTAYALYGRKSGQLVSIYWAPSDAAACPMLAKQFNKAPGKPNDIDETLATTTWEREADGYTADFLQRAGSCRLSLSPVDPYPLS